MPELPEVETIVRTLEPHLVGKRIAAVATSGLALRGTAPDARALGALRGHTITAVERLAKYILIHLDSGQSLVIHLGMTGQLVTGAAANRPSPHRHIALELAPRGTLALYDPRRFGTVFVVARDRLHEHKALRALGPDAYRELDPKAFARCLRATRRCLKAVLLDQRVLAGVGNIYASEALFLAGLHPAQIARLVSSLGAKRLAAAVVQTLRQGIANSGTTFRDYVYGEGALGENLDTLYVFLRTGQPCRVCGAAIQHVVQGGRSSYFCLRCQPRRSRDGRPAPP